VCSEVRLGQRFLHRSKGAEMMCGRGDWSKPEQVARATEAIQLVADYFRAQLSD
jgi:hypothetical protein